MRTHPGKKTILLAIDDDPIALDLVREYLSEEGLELYFATDAEEGLELIEEQHPQILLVDLKMPTLNGDEVIERALGFDPEIKAILMTLHYSPETAVAAIERGACDTLAKPLDPGKLVESVRRLVQEMGAARTAERLEQELAQTAQFEGMIGRGPEMQAVFERIRHVAPHFRTALVTGPTGTGKELAAHALHAQSPVAKMPFAIVNCSAIVETLFESELFGHVRGAFTGAVQDKVGVFEFANGGTVFLDEIGELPLSMQAKLLRVLQQGEVQRVGSPQPKKISVRIVAATNRDLRAMVEARQFREDLFYRLSMVEVKLPALCRRGEDVPLLLRHMVEKYAALYGKPIQKVSLGCQQLLLRYDWPGNVRELENVIGSACMTARGSVLDVQDLPEQIRDMHSLRWGTATEGAMDEPQAGEMFMGEGGSTLPLHEMEKRYVRFVLGRLNGNKLRTAEALGIGRATLYRLLAEDAPVAEPQVAAAAQGRVQ